ncbi:Elongation factor 1-gamma, partial [Nowakowskiella sp. JEL0078]
KIYSYPNNHRVAKVIIAAKYNGLEVELVPVEIGKDNKVCLPNFITPEFLNKFPLGKVPAFESSNGFTLFESNAITSYVASYKKDTTLLGSSKEEAASIQQWISLCDNEIVPAAAAWLFPINGWIPNNETNTKNAQENIKNILSIFDKHLLTKTFFVGESVTLADITVATSLLGFYRAVFDLPFRAPYKNVNRWFTTVINQPIIKEVLGEVVLAEKAAVALTQAKKAEVKKEQVKEKKPEAKKEKPKEEKKKEEKKPKKKDDDEEEEEENYQDEKPKGKNPLDLLPPSTFNLDEWKRFYSNNETRPTAINWFWEKFDPTGFSIYKVEYKYNSELTMTFMSSNLVGGFFQRLESARKYAFGSLVILGKDSANEIVGYFVFRGEGIPQEVQDAADFESYNFTKKSHTDNVAKEEFASFIAWDEFIGGKPFADGKVFK